MSFSLLHLRASKENERGPIYAEPAIAALYSLNGDNARVSFEMGMGADGKIGFYARASEDALQLIQSQMYAQYPETDIEILPEDPFAAGEGEEVYSLELEFDDPEVYPIKRYPQFDDMLSRVNVDSIAGLTSAIGQNALPGVRTHSAIIFRPIKDGFRRRCVRFLPLLKKGMPSVSKKYSRFFTKVVLARGWKRWLYMPLCIFMGGFRAWPGFSKFSGGGIIAVDAPQTSDPDLDEIDAQSARNHDREDALGAAADKVSRLLYAATVRLSVIVPKGQGALAKKKLEEMAGSYQQFALPQCNSFNAGPITSSTSVSHDIGNKTLVLSAEEIATMWHMPTILVQTPNIDWVMSKKLEPPINLPIPGVTDPEGSLTVLGEAVFRGRRQQFGIRPIDRARHCYIIGKTGMGKSTLLENMVFSDIHSGKGVGVIDPHGDLIEAILEFTPKSRSNDVILFDPADRDFPVSFNMLDCPDPTQRNRICSGLMSVFTKLWPDVWSGRMEHILRNSLLALLESEGTSMLGILRLYADPHFRNQVVSRVTDPMVKSFWEDEYASWSDNYRTEAVSAIQNKIGQLLSTPMIRNIVGQVKSTLDVRHAMDSGKIVLVNLSKGKIGEDVSAFLGSMLVTKFQIDAMSRADIPEKERREFYLYVDEFQNFATESFAEILSEARKYKLALTMANQYVSQLLIGDRDTTLRDAVFGNVGSLISFQVGSDDAEVFSLQYEEMVTPKDILSLPKYHAYVRLMIDGMPSKPFSVSTLPPPDFTQAEGRVDVLRRQSRQRYSEKREVVERNIRKWAASASEAKKNAAKDQKAKEKEEEEKKKAKKKGMSLEDYRKWRDRELWINDFNMLRKRHLLDEDLSEDEKKEMADLEKKLTDSGGVPEVSKGLQELLDKKAEKGS